MEKTRVIKPIAFNLIKDADLLEWIEIIEKTEKLNYAQYVRRLINCDMLNKKNGNVVIANNTTTSQAIDINKLTEQIMASVKNILPNNEVSSNLNSNINIIDNNIEEIKSDLNEDDFSNLNDIMNGNF